MPAGNGVNCLYCPEKEAGRCQGNDTGCLCFNIGNIQGKHSTKEILQEKGTQKAPLHIKKYIENAIPYKKPVGRVNLAYV